MPSGGFGSLRLAVSVIFSNLFDTFVGAAAGAPTFGSTKKALINVGQPPSVNPVSQPCADCRRPRVHTVIILQRCGPSRARHATFVPQKCFVIACFVEIMNHAATSPARPHALVPLLIFVLAFSVGAAGAGRSLSPKDRQEIFEKVWKEVDEHYYDPQFSGVNWQEIHQRYLPIVEAATDDQDFYSIVDHMTAELHDAHTRFSSPEQWENREKHQGISLGFRPGYVEDKVVVLDVAPDANAAHAGVAPGMIVTALDGQPIADRLAESAKSVLPSSTERVTRLRILSNAFAASVETPVTLSLQRADGSIFEAKFARQILSNAPRVTYTRLPSGFGYIRFDEFHPSLVKDFKAALQNLRNTPGLVLDLRRNRGGVGATLEAMAGYFFDSKTLFEKRMTRKQVTATERDGHHTEESQFYVGRVGGRLYSAPVVILISEYSASATEVFAAGMQDAARATLVGSRSCGCVLGITHDRVMKGGGVLEISEILWFSPKGRKLEGEGVIPDKVVAPTIASLQQKHDLILEAGETILRQHMAPPPPNP
jgi:carboxyl-terminal processing protease